MRIDADAGIGEFCHVGAADHNEAGPAQPRHHGRVGLGGSGILQRAGASAGHLPPDIEQILDRHGNAGVGRRRGVGLAQPVHGVGGPERGFPVDVDEDTLAFAGGVGDPGEALLDKLPRGGRAAVEICGQCG